MPLFGYYFPFRPADIFNSAVRARAQQIATVESIPIQLAMRRAIVDELRSRESRWPDASSGPAKQGFVGTEEHGQ